MARRTASIAADGRRTRSIILGLRANLGQFLLLVLINGLVGARSGSTAGSIR